jgi:hypothetical protein
MSTVKTPTFDPFQWRGHAASGTKPVPCPAALSGGMIVSAKHQGKTTTIQLSVSFPNDEYEGRVIGFEPPASFADDVACDDAVKNNEGLYLLGAFIAQPPPATDARKRAARG